MTFDANDETRDRRIRRTRVAIVSAFNRLILTRGYASLTPGDVAESADIGRSTFYAHFKSVDDLLGHSVGALLTPLAKGCLGACYSEDAQRIVEHIWENRRIANILFSGEAQPVVLRSLTAAFEVALQPFLRSDGPDPILTTDVIALQLAAGHLAVLSSWVSGRTGRSAQQITAALQVSSRAAAFALLRLS